MIGSVAAIWRLATYWPMYPTIATSVLPMRFATARSASVIGPALFLKTSLQPLSKVKRYAIVPSVMTLGSKVPRFRIAASAAASSLVGAPAAAAIALRKASSTSGARVLWRARIASTVKPLYFSTSPPRTVVACFPGSPSEIAVSVTVGAPITCAPVCIPTEAASDMWSKCACPTKIALACFTSLGPKPIGRLRGPRS